MGLLRGVVEVVGGDVVEVEVVVVEVGGVEVGFQIQCLSQPRIRFSH